MERWYKKEKKKKQGKKNIRKKREKNKKQNLSHQSLALLAISLWICCLWSLLSPASMFSEVRLLAAFIMGLLEGLLCRWMSNAVYALFLATWLKLQANQSLQLPLPSLGVHKKVQNMLQGWLLLAQAQGRAVNVPEHPGIYLHLP